jgi:hypothetical protein
MGRLYAVLFLMLVVFSASMSLIAAGVYNSHWWVWVIGVGILVLFLILGPVIPRTQKAVPPRDAKTAKAALGAFGALLALAFFTMAMVCWVVGNRTLYLNNAYQVLGFLIFLGLAGLGINGAMGAIFMFTYVRHRTLVEAAEVTPA